MSGRPTPLCALKRCQVCGSKQILAANRRADGRSVYQCQACGVKQVHIRPSDVTLHLRPEYFHSKATFEQDGIRFSRWGYIEYESRWSTDPIWQTQLLRLFADGRKSVLDLGCATGTFLDAARELGCEVEGVEISPAAARLAQLRGIGTFVGKFEAFRTSKRYDAITAWEMIEHIPRIADTLKKIKKLLKPTGVFLFSTPDAGRDKVVRSGNDWLGYHVSLEHIYYFSKEALTRLISSIFGTRPLMASIHRGKDLWTLVGIVRLPDTQALDTKVIRALSGKPEVGLPRRTIEDCALIASSMGSSEIARTLVSQLPVDYEWANLLRKAFVLVACGQTETALETFRKTNFSPSNRVEASMAISVHDRLMVELQERWIEANDQLQKARLTLGNASDQLQSLTQSNQSLQDQLQSAKNRLQVREATLSEATRELDSTRKQIDQLQEQVQTLVGRNQSVQDQLDQIKVEHSRLTEELDRTKKELEELRHSFGYKFMRSYASYIDRLLPDGTTRGKFRRIVTASLRIIAEEGMTSFSRKALEKIRRREFRIIELQEGVSDVLAVHPSQEILQSQQKTQQALIQTFPGKYDVFFFPIIDFDFVYVQRPQHLARRFAREGHRVFYLRTDFQNSKSWKPPVVEQVEQNIYQIRLASPRSINLYSDEIDDISLDWFRSQFDWLEAHYAPVDGVCLVELPFWMPLVKQLQVNYDWKVVYDCLDYVGGFSNVSETVLRQEEALVRTADLVLATSRVLFERCSKSAKKCVLLKNAGEYERFSLGGAIPQDLRNLKRPIVGYYGSIADWFDVELVAKIASANPDKTFVIIGQVRNADVSTLKELENVHLLGPRPYEKLPLYLQEFDVCFIPFKRMELTAATDPVKLYEMFSAGKPIVTVDLPELRELGDLIYVADSADEFASKIDQALSERRQDPLRGKRKQYAFSNTWDQRFAILLSEIKALYEPISVVVIAYNNKELTRACIDSIFENTTYPALEVIVVDNASTDGTAQMLAELKNDRAGMNLYANTKNMGFARAVNQALRKCNGRYVFVVNNDVIVTRGSLSRLIRHLKNDPAIGLICPVTNSAGNEVSLELPAQYPPDQKWLFSFALRTSRELRGMLFPIRTVPLYLAGLTRTVLEEVGMLDERFEIGMFEDDDWSHRVRLGGHTTVCAEDVFVFHAGRAAFKLLGEGQYLRVFSENKKRYEAKWGTSWIPYAGDRAARRVAIKTTVQELELVLAEYPSRPVVIFPPTIGWSVPLFQRPHHLASKLAEMGFLVFFSVDGSRYDSGKDFEKISDGLYKSNIPHEAYTRIDKPIVFTTCYNRQYLQYYRRPIVIYDYLDDISVHPYDQSLLKMQHDWLLEHAQLVVASADTLFEEVQRVREDGVLCPNGVDFRLFSDARTRDLPDDIRKIREEGLPVLGYTGAISRWLDYELLERVTDLKPEVNFVLIGQELDVSIRKTNLAQRKNVRLLGARDYRDIPRYLNGFDATLLPFRADRIGATTSPIKLYEYFAAGKPVVSTNMRECTKYAEVLASRDYYEFAENIGKALEMSRDPSFTSRLRQIAEANTWDVRVRTIVEALAKKGLLEGMPTLVPP